MGSSVAFLGSLALLGLQERLAKIIFLSQKSLIKFESVLSLRSTSSYQFQTQSIKMLWNGTTKPSEPLTKHDPTKSPHRSSLQLASLGAKPSNQKTLHLIGWPGFFAASSLGNVARHCFHRIRLKKTMLMNLFSALETRSEARNP